MSQGVIIDSEMDEKKVPERIRPQDLHNKPGCLLAIVLDENNVMQMVINSTNELYLWAAWKRLENAIGFVLQQEEIKRQATAVQTVPASMMDKLRK